MFRAWGDWRDDELRQMRDSLELGRERSMDKDAAFGIRQLVDIAVRALSPGINDPTTAVQAIDRIHDVLHRLARRQIPSPVRQDEDGTVRIYIHRFGWEDYVLLAVEEIRLSAAGQIHVTRRLRQMLLDVLEAAPPERHGPIEAAIERVDRSARRHLDDDIDRRIARPAEAQGHGPMAS